MADDPQPTHPIVIPPVEPEPDEPKPDDPDKEHPAHPHEGGPPGRSGIHPDNPSEADDVRGKPDKDNDKPEKEPV